MADLSQSNDTDLAIGAEAIARHCFDGKVSARQVYRMAEQGWPIFYILGKLAARPSAIRREMARREEHAVNSRE